MTSLDWLKKKTEDIYDQQGSASRNYMLFLIEQAQILQKDDIINAIMYALDEDGHTGEWKIKFANDYYNKLNQGYDVSNKTREGFSGEETL